MTRRLHVALIATECFPFAKVGGLADVVGSLPREFEALGARVEVVIPDPGDLNPKLFGPAEQVPSPPFRFRGGTHSARVQRVGLPGSAARVFLIGGDGFFPRPNLYVDPATGGDYADQLDRWVFFQRAALALLAEQCPNLDVLHCHEHQTALVPFYLPRIERPGTSLGRTVTVLTIHNLGYQGMFGADQWRVIELDDGLIRPGGALEYYGRINLMKGGILSADALTVVSPTYAREIQTEAYGSGLESVIAQRANDLYGILNGIDLTVWNPRTDPWIPARFSDDDLSGKRVNREALLERFGFARTNRAWPVLAIVSRIDYQKGFDLVLEILGDLLEQPLYLLLLGTGNREIEQSIERVVQQHADRAAACFEFDDALAHQIIAGADILLMPSRYEPCGLTQMYGLQYGTIPVVRATGGLADTIEEYDPANGEGTGFRFSSYDAEAFRAAIDRARNHWRNQPVWRRLIENGMRRDFTWTDSARRYLDVFEKTLNRRRPSD